LTVAAPPPPPPTCSVTFEQNPIGPGSGTYINWSSSGADWFYLNGIGYVDASGEAWVAPSKTTNYDGSVGNASGEAKCPATLTVASDGAKNTCPRGYTWDEGTKKCVFTGCPAGYVQQGEQCVPAAKNNAGGQCTTGYFCRGNDQYQRNAQCAETFVQGCAWGCSGGGCLPPPAPTGDIKASPSLVKKQATTKISWTTQHTTACTVTEDNPAIADAWTGSSGSETSSRLEEQTVYTLRCTGVDGSTFTDTATVRIIPLFEEQ
jgi:hypothetical protein